MEKEDGFYPVTCGSQSQPGQAGRRQLAGLQIDGSGLLVLKVPNQRSALELLTSIINPKKDP